jgi:hypothetical protein
MVSLCEYAEIDKYEQHEDYNALVLPENVSIKMKLIHTKSYRIITASKQ